MANSDRDKKDSASTSSSREESGGMRGSPSGSNQGDGFETGNVRQGGMSGAGTGGRDSGQQGDRSSGSGPDQQGGNRNASGAGQQAGNRDTSRDSGLDDSRDRGMSGSSGTSGSTGFGGEAPEDATSPPGGVEGTSTRDGREDPDRGSQR